MRDANGLQYHRARYYSPALGVFTALDPVEGSAQQVMSLNRYGYVAGNVVNAVDPSGMIGEHPGAWDSCAQIDEQCELNCSYQAQIHAQWGIPFSYNFCVERCRESSALEKRRRLLRSYIDNLYGCLSTQFPGNYTAVLGMECNLSESEYPSGSVDAMVKILEYGARLYPRISSKELVGEISRILLGTSGCFTVLNQVLFSATDDHPLAREGGVGFHSDYYESAGQVHHFWAYLDTVAQGGSLVATQADIFHECVQGGGRVEDARLSTVAFSLGEAVSNGLDPFELAQKIQSSLGENGTGFGRFFAEHYYTDEWCRRKLIEWNQETELPYPPGFRP
ncbi:MAG: RHS repeat-associated core domain-containing protein [Anaerolineae bacterium]|nr:RHS repeat-associated core domain-containing protein [Anaerolineae bacterium]